MGHALTLGLSCALLQALLGTSLQRDAFALALGAVALGAPPRGGVLQTGRPLQEVLIHVGAVAGEEAGPIAGKAARSLLLRACARLCRGARRISVPNRTEESLQNKYSKIFQNGI